MLTCSIEAIRKSGGRLNEWAIKEMVDYLRRIGYKVSGGSPSSSTSKPLLTLAARRPEPSKRSAHHRNEGQGLCVRVH